MENKISIELNGREYPLAANLRVAYEVQGQHNHKPYAELFKTLGDMTVEDQIGIVYASFKVANRDDAKAAWTREVFKEYCLDNYNIKDLMDKMQGIIACIMGEEPEALSSTNQQIPAEVEEGNK